MISPAFTQDGKAEREQEQDCRSEREQTGARAVAPTTGGIWFRFCRPSDCAPADQRKGTCHDHSTLGTRRGKRGVIESTARHAASQTSTIHHLSALHWEEALAWSRDQRRITNQVTHRRSRHRAMPSCKTPIERSPPWPSGACDVHWQGDPLAHLNQFRQLGQASSSSLRYQSEPAQPRNW